jgi:hypothetical protein
MNDYHPVWIINVQYVWLISFGTENSSSADYILSMSGDYHLQWLIIIPRVCSPVPVQSTIMEKNRPSWMNIVLLGRKSVDVYRWISSVVDEYHLLLMNIICCWWISSNISDKHLPQMNNLEKVKFFPSYLSRTILFWVYYLGAVKTIISVLQKTYLLHTFPHITHQYAG